MCGIIYSLYVIILVIISQLTVRMQLGIRYIPINCISILSYVVTETINTRRISWEFLLLDLETVSISPTFQVTDDHDIQDQN
jgi:hypothetical protein